jgi:hypothetical protein
MTAYRKGSGGPTDVAMAAAAGLLAGSVVFYLARVWFQREPIGAIKGRGAPPDGEVGSRGGDGSRGEDGFRGEDVPDDEDLPPDGEASPSPDRPSDSAPS